MDLFTQNTACDYTTGCTLVMAHTGVISDSDVVSLESEPSSCPSLLPVDHGQGQYNPMRSKATLIDGSVSVMERTRKALTYEMSPHAFIPRCPRI